MTLTNYCYLDLETKKSSDDFKDKWGTNVPSFLDEKETDFVTTNILQMEFGVAATYSNQGVKFWTDPNQLLLYLLDPEIDAIVTFNGERFDLLVLLAAIDPPVQDGGNVTFSDAFKETYSTLLLKSIDILREIENALGHRLQLDQITQAIFHVKKEIEGKAWWTAYNSTNIEKRTQAVNYLLGDVVQLYQIFGVAHELNQLAYVDPLGKVTKFNIKIKTAEDLKK